MAELGDFIFALIKCEIHGIPKRMKRL